MNKDQQCLLCGDEKKIEHHLCPDCFGKTAPDDFTLQKLHILREKILLKALTRKGLKCEWQKPVPYEKTEYVYVDCMNGNVEITYEQCKHIDIAIDSYKLYIEIQGKHHQEDGKQRRSDMWRNYYANKEGYLPLHIPNNVFVSKKIFDDTVHEIIEIAKCRKKDLERA